MTISAVGVAVGLGFKVAVGDAASVGVRVSVGRLVASTGSDLVGTKEKVVQPQRTSRVKVEINFLNAVLRLNVSGFSIQLPH